MQELHAPNSWLPFVLHATHSISVPTVIQLPSTPCEHIYHYKTSKMRILQHILPLALHVWPAAAGYLDQWKPIGFSIPTDRSSAVIFAEFAASHYDDRASCAKLDISGCLENFDGRLGVPWKG